MLVLRPVEVQRRGPVAVGAMLWRHRGTLHLTAIVRAHFTIVPDGAASIALPEELRPEIDRVPFRARADVIVEGRARAHGELLRLAVGRDDRTLIDKVIRVAGDPAAAPLAFGRAARVWADRDVPVPEIAADVDWMTFQSALADQQTEYLSGDEWIVLEGLHPTIPRVVARLPSVRAQGTVHGALEENGPLERAIDFDADTLTVDPDRLACSVTWRAAMPIANERDLSRIRLSLGITVHDQPILDAGPLLAKPASLESTLSLTSEAVEQAMREARALPFIGHDGNPSISSTPTSAAAKATSSSRHPFEGTLDLSDTTKAAPAWFAPAPPTRPSEDTIQIGADTLASRPSAPFPIAAPSDRTPPSAPIPGAPWAPPTIASVPRPVSAFEGTLDLTPRAPSPPPPPPDPSAAPLTARTPTPPAYIDAAPVDVVSVDVVHAAPAPVEAPSPPKHRPPPGPDLNQGLYSRFTSKKK